MTDETGTESHSQDVVSAEEFLFGTVSDDAPADDAGEFPAGDVTNDAGDTEIAGEPDVADADGGQTAPADTEASEELKVVLSIRSGRATIGVQRPSADPHIESFDDPDLFELADEFPAVVARAIAIWEKEPRHPAYVKPTPSPRQRNRRQQATAEAETTEGEAEQSQPETLRLF